LIVDLLKEEYAEIDWCSRRGYSKNWRGKVYDVEEFNQKIQKRVPQYCSDCDLLTWQNWCASNNI
jgi:hypothetical protein